MMSFAIAYLLLISQLFQRRLALERVEEGGEVHWYWKKGIEFSYDADTKVRSISIFKSIGAAPAEFDETLLRE